MRDSPGKLVDAAIVVGSLGTGASWLIVRARPNLAGCVEKQTEEETVGAGTHARAVDQE